MPRPLSLALLIVGVILLGFAVFAGDSVSSGISKLFQGTPDDRTIILLVAGALTFGLGLFGTLRAPKT